LSDLGVLHVPNGAPQAFSFRRAGAKPPAYVVERLARLYPQVRLVWNGHVNRWQLVQRCYDRSWEHLCFLVGPRGEPLPPDYHNVIRRLQAGDLRRLENEYELARWLGAIDEHNDALGASDEPLAADRIKEGTDALWRAFGKKVVVPVSSGERPMTRQERRQAWRSR
jgi:hypothetical protein